MSESPLRLALVGTGRIGQVHAMGVAGCPGAVLQVVCDALPDSAQRTAHRYGGRVVLDAEEAVRAEDVDAVVIASPTPTHVDLLTACIEAGKAALCEKPIDLDLARVDAVRERAGTAKAPIMLGFNRRFDPHFGELRRRVAAGEIGPLEHLAVTSRDPEPAPAEYIASSGGIFKDMSIHDLDIARWFVPDIVSASAVGLHQFSDEIRGLGDYDGAVITLTGAGGESVVITNSRHSAFGYDQRLEAFGPLGMLQVGNIADTVVRRSGAGEVDAGAPYQRFFLERYRHAYAAELAAFVAAANGEQVQVPGFEDGRAALLLADAAGRSAASGSVVDVDLRA